MLENGNNNYQYSFVKGEVKINRQKTQDVDFEDALEQTGFGKFNVCLIIVCGLCLYASNSECYSVGYVLPSAGCEFSLDAYKKGILTSASFVGVMLSCTFWGYLSDTKGRRKLLMMNLIAAFLATLVAAVTPSFWGFVVLRFINGICISGPSAIIFVYFGEFQSASNKSKAMYMSFFIAGALIGLPALGWLLLQQSINFSFIGLHLNNWRIFVLVNGIPNIIVALALCRLPESPRYLFYNGNYAEALQVLKKMYVVNTGKSEESFGVENLKQTIIFEKSLNAERGIMSVLTSQIVPLFKPPLLAYTLAACFMQAGVFAISSGLFLWYPDIINQLSSSGNSSLTICQALSLTNIKPENGPQCNETVDNQVFILNIIVGCAYIFAFWAWGVLVNCIGNRVFFIACMIISSLGTVILCYLTNKILIDIFFISIMIFPGVCVAVISVWMVDIFPTNICAMAVCTTLTAGRFGSIFSSSIVGIMLQWDCMITFMLYAISLVVCLMLSLLLPKKN